MSGTERIVDVNVAEVGKLFAKLLAVLFLARFETGVLEQHALAVLKRGNLAVSVLAHEVGSERHLIVKQLVKTDCDGPKRELLGVVLLRLFDVGGFGGCLLVLGQSFDGFLFLFGKTETFGEDVVRLAEVRAKNYLRAVLHQVLDGGKRAHDSVLVRDVSVRVERHVEVATHKNLFALYVYVSYSLFVHNLLLVYFGLLLYCSFLPVFSQVFSPRERISAVL